VVVDHTRTLGVDLSAQAKQTAVCLLTWDDGRATIDSLILGADDLALLELIRTENPTKVAIDAPFGWPAPFVAAISQHAAGAAWEAHATEVLRLRATDLHVIAETGQRPLSVSADRIAVTAFRCAGLLSKLARAGHPVERSGSGLAVEVYPASALRLWDLDPRGYKGGKPEQRSRRAQLVADLGERVGSFLVLDDEHRALLVASDHLLDALVCSLIARATLVGETLPIPKDLTGLAAVEGWIALPHRGSLSDLGHAVAKRPS